MNRLFIKGSEDTPEINFDPHAEFLIIGGRSLPEDVVTFFQPVMDWLKLYCSESKMVTLSINLEYFNTASSKILLDMFMMLEDHASKGGQVLIRWNYKSNDSDMLEAGEEYAELVEIPFEMIPN